jgi:hypothetical protein
LEHAKEEGTIVDGRRIDCECDFKMIKGKDLRQAKNRLTILPLGVVTAGGRNGSLLKGAPRDHSWSFVLLGLSVKTIVSGGNRRQLAAC